MNNISLFWFLKRQKCIVTIFYSIVEASSLGSSPEIPQKSYIGAQKIYKNQLLFEAFRSYRFIKKNKGEDN
jgi:hypothetical protein